MKPRKAKSVGKSSTSQSTRSTRGNPKMPCGLCGSDDQSADNAFLCEYYGIIPALAPRNSLPSPLPSVQASMHKNVDDNTESPSRNSLFALADKQCIPQLFETTGVPAQPAGSVRVVIVSDTHERHRELNVPPGDILLHAGDILEGLNVLHKPKKVLSDFFAWLNEQTHAVKVVIAGNHDRELSNMKKEAIRTMASPALYLEDEAALVQPIGLRIFGSPRSEANSRWSPNGAYQGASWWKPMFTAAAPAEREAHDTTTSLAAEGGLSSSPLLSVHLEGPQPGGPVDILLTHQSAEFGSAVEVSRQAITKFIQQAAPRRLHCAGHLHASHGLHKLPVPPIVKENYGLRVGTPHDGSNVATSLTPIAPIPFLPSINAAMLVRSQGRTVLQRPCVVDIEL